MSSVMSGNVVVGCYLIGYTCYYVLVLFRIESGGRIGLKMGLETQKNWFLGFWYSGNRLPTYGNRFPYEKSHFFLLLEGGNPVTHLGEPVTIQIFQQNIIFVKTSKLHNF